MLRSIHLATFKLIVRFHPCSQASDCQWTSVNIRSEKVHVRLEHIRNAIEDTDLRGAPWLDWEYVQAPKSVLNMNSEPLLEPRSGSFRIRADRRPHHNPPAILETPARKICPPFVETQLGIAQQLNRHRFPGQAPPNLRFLK